jgi:ribulose-phosphate 3-epimerase
VAAVPDVRALRALGPTISVGVLTADLLALGSELALLARAGVRIVHVDVMDGCFTPAMTVGPPFVKALRTPLVKDVHLMINEPLRTIREYVAAGADIVTVHSEACTHVHRVLQELGALPHAADPARRVIRGIALNPGTPLSVLDPLVDDLELIMLLAVNPGWGGQRFIPSTFDRIEQVKAVIAALPHPVVLAVDGGVTRDNIGAVAATGVNLIVTGSAVFDGKNAAANAEFMLEAVRRTRTPHASS